MQSCPTTADHHVPLPPHHCCLATASVAGSNASTQSLTTRERIVLADVLLKIKKKTSADVDSAATVSLSGPP